jgi:uncharacterized protein
MDCRVPSLGARRSVVTLTANSCHLCRPDGRHSSDAYRGDDRADSGVDFLVDVEPRRTLLDVIALGQDLQALLQRSVSGLTDDGLSPYLQQRILAEASAL